MKSLRPSRAALVAAATGLLALPALSGAAQSGTVGFQCKFPLTGTTPRNVEVKATLDFPTTVRASEQIPSSTLRTQLTIHDLGDTIDAVPAIAAVRGTVTTTTTVKAPSGILIPALSTAEIGTTPVPRPSSNLISVNLGSPYPSLTFDDPGKVTVSLTGITANLTALDSSGQPVFLPRVTTDPAGNPVTDSDGDNSPFDVVCAVAPRQNTQIAKVNIRR